MSNLPDLEAWAIFVRVVETGSFARAAQLLGLSQPTVSKAINRLERQLGAALLYRTSRWLSLTHTGEIAIERAAKMLNEGETLEAEVARQTRTPRGTIRLTAPMSFGTRYLAPLLPAFLDRYPDIRLDVALGDELVDLVAGGFDLAIRIADLPDSSLRARRLCTVRLLLVASPEYVARHGLPSTPLDLAHRACFVNTDVSTPGLWRFHHASGKEHTVALTGRVRSNNADVVFPALLAGHGMALQPEYLVREPLEQGSLIQLLPDWTVPPIHLNLVTPAGIRLRPVRVTALLDYLSESLRTPSGAPAAQGCGSLPVQTAR